MEIKCAYTELVDIDLLVPNSRNPNKHSDAQLKLLAKIMGHQGWRHPVIVSKRSGFVCAGHGRIESARINGWVKCPVDYQDFKDEAQEYAFLVADNKIAELAETSMEMILEDLPKFEDLDFDMLGIPGFKLPEDFSPGSLDEQGKLDEAKIVIMECPHCGESFEKQQAKIIG